MWPASQRWSGLTTAVRTHQGLVGEPCVGPWQSCGCPRPTVVAVAPPVVLSTMQCLGTCHYCHDDSWPQVQWRYHAPLPRPAPASRRRGPLGFLPLHSSASRQIPWAITVRTCSCYRFCMALPRLKPLALAQVHAPRLWPELPFPLLIHLALGFAV